MKLLIIILSSILLACSVTIANPVLPSATTSIEYGTLSTPNTQVESVGDLGQLSKEAICLIKEYAQINSDCEEMKKLYDLTESKKLVQEELVKQLGEEYQHLKRKSQKGKNDLKDHIRFRTIKQRLKEQKKEFIDLEREHLDLNFDYFFVCDELNRIKRELVKCVFGKHSTSRPISYYMELLTSNLEFAKLVDTFRNSAPSQQLGSEQAFTSGTQSSSQRYDNPSLLYDNEMEVSKKSDHILKGSDTMHPSSEAPIVQPTQASSSTERASRSCSRSRKLCSRIKSSIGSLWNQHTDDDREPLV
ncbi:hypothetical protein O5D80_007464 [Batrachochytrium dendrobatidis]|nr:hypothetical protein O5D80_007464 [Batrachochytrium dendrobatidis]